MLPSDSQNFQQIHTIFWHLVGLGGTVCLNVAILLHSWLKVRLELTISHAPTAYASYVPLSFEVNEYLNTSRKYNNMLLKAPEYFSSQIWEKNSASS